MTSRNPDFRRWECLQQLHNSFEMLQEVERQRRERKKIKKERETNKAPPQIQQEQMWIKYERTKGVWKVKLHSALHRVGGKQSERKRDRSFRSCNQALSADACQAVPHEVPLWSEMLLVHYGWGDILRHWGSCLFIFEPEEMTPDCCQALSWSMYSPW